MKREVFEGQKFKLTKGTIATVVKYINCSEVHIKTNTGYENIVSSGRLKSGKVQDRLQRTVYEVGYIGIGKYTSNSKSGSKWFKILGRAYDDETSIMHPTYTNCIVADIWHDLQNFGKWFDNNNIDGYHLDKDLKCPGNKVYGPDTCIFVPQEINKFFKIHPYKNENLPHGVIRIGLNFSKIAICNSKLTIKEAVNDYWNWKYEKTISLTKKYPEFKDLILNYFEYYFNLLYPEYIKNKLIVDLEGCLSNAKHRMHLLKENKFSEFQIQFKNDIINENIDIFIKQFKGLREVEIIILTAKQEEYRELVVKWLEKYNVLYDKLIMKNENLSDIKFKERYAKIHKEEILFALDDVGKNAKMFSDNGIPCLRVEQYEQ